jgi:hypothetical protein
MSTLTIRHSHKGGTQIEGTAKGDGTGPILKAHGWRWGRSITSWYIQNTRDRDAVTWKIERTATALRVAGFDVEVSIDNTARPVAEVEADKQERLENRAEALDAKAERRDAQADAAEARRKASLARVPEGGEPIKIGHHSEKRHRKAIDTAWNDLGKSVEADRAADEAHRRAEACRANVDYRQKPVVIARRIEKLKKEAAKWQKSIDSMAARGEVSERHNEGLRREQEAIAYWEEIHAQHIEDGLFKVYTREDVKPGDWVKIKGRWELVHKSNPKTCAIDVSQTFRLPPGSHWLPYQWIEVQDHRTPYQMQKAREEFEAKAVAEA